MTDEQRERARAAVRKCLRKRRARLQANGLCVDCGRRQAARVLCTECAARHAERGRARRIRLKLAGLCARCGRRPCRVDCDQCESCAPSVKNMLRKAVLGREAIDAAQVKRLLELAQRARKVA